MKLVNPTLEARAIRCITDGNKVVSSFMLSSLDPSYFHNQSCLDAFQRIKSIVKNKGNPPAFFEVCADPIIDEAARKFLKKKRPKLLKSKERAQGLVETLLRYRRLRQLYFMYENGQKELLKSKVDLEKLIEVNGEELTAARSELGAKKELLHMGAGDNTAEIQKRLLSNDKPPMIPTGFAGWDKRNGGLGLSSLMIIAATSGGGKSALANQFLLNTTRCGYTACLVALEMSEEDCMSRIYANLSEIEVNKFAQRRTSLKEKKRARIRYRKYKKEMQKLDSRYSIYSPDEDVTIDEVLFTLRPYEYDLIVIDYAGLLAGLDADDQWRKLSGVARQCKNYARIHNKAVVLLAQLNDDGLIRYSKGMKEHADVMWSWTYTDTNRETGMLYIVPQKARNQDPTPFELFHDFRYMQVRDPTKQEMMNSQGSKEASKKRDKLDKTAKKMEDYLSV